VRAALWERGAGQLFPAELTVTESGDGVRVTGPFRAPPVSLALSPDGRGRPGAVAATGDHPGLAIRPGPDDTVLVTANGWPTAVPVDTGPQAAPLAAMPRQPGGGPGGAPARGGP
jgi:hypothetical protein